MLLEQDELTSGSTWHAAGLCTQFNPSYNLDAAAALQRRALQDRSTADYHECGSVRLATTPDRVDEFRHRAAMAELARRPGRDRRAGARRASCTRWSRSATCSRRRTCRPTGTSTRAASRARSSRAPATRIFRHAPVTALERARRRWTLETSKGDVRAGIVVNAAGQWAPQGRPAGGRRACRSSRSSTTTSSPTRCRRWRRCPRSCRCSAIRTASFYVRQEGAGLLVGPFEREPLPWALDGSRTSTRGCCRPTSTASRACSRTRPRACPPSRTAGIKTVVNGPDGYTPGRPLPDGARAGPARLPRARRLQHLRHRLRGRRRALRGRVDRRRPAERQHVGARRPPLRRVRARRRRSSSPRAHARSTSASTRSTTRRRSAAPGGR